MLVGAGLVASSVRIAMALACVGGCLMVSGCSRRQAPDVAPVAGQAAEVPTQAPSQTARARVAVLPFESEGAAEAGDYFADGMADHFVLALSRLPGVVVISPESSFRYKQSGELNSVIGEALSATHVLQGKVAREGDVLKVSTSLVRSSDGQAIWSEEHQRLQGKLFEVQDDITKALAKALGSEWVEAGAQDDRPAGGNLAAYDAVLKGNAAAKGVDIFSAREAVEAYAQATQLDPAYAHAHALLAQARVRQLTRFPLEPEQVREEGEQARRDAGVAMRLAPDSAESHRAQGAWLAGVALDQAGAMHETRQALDLRPNDASLLHALAIQQTAFGQLRDASDTLRRTLDLNPLSAPVLYNLGSVYLGLADYAQAEHVLRRALALEPSLSLVHAFLAMAVFQQGRTAEAVGIAEKERVVLWRRYALSMAAWANGDRDRSESELQDLIREQGNEAATQIAGIYAQRDDRDAMFHWLGVAKDTGDPGIVEIRYMPFVSRYADDPRFVTLARELDLMPETATAPAPN